MHADHITGTGYLKQLLPNVKSVISGNSGAKADKYVNEGDSLAFGRHNLSTISTPGHTNGCVSYIVHEQVRKSKSQRKNIHQTSQMDKISNEKAIPLERKPQTNAILS